MRLFAVLFLLVGLIRTSYGQDKKNDLYAEDLRGSVKSIKIRGFRAIGGAAGAALKGGLIHTTEKSYTTNGYLMKSTSAIGGNKIGGVEIPYRSATINYKYDKYNNLLGSCSYNTQGLLEDSSVHEVDKRGNRIIWKIFKGNGAQEWEYVSEYDNTGNLLEVNDYHWTKLITRHTYRYNDHSKCTMESDYTPDGRLKSKKLYNYDERWNRVEETSFDGSGAFEYRRTYVYNQWGNPIEEREYKTDGSDKHTKILREYDKDDNVTRIRQYDENGRMVYQGRFDAHGNHLADITYNANGTVREKVTADYEYDSFGNETLEMLKLSERSPAIKSVYKYDYDYEGNWIKKTVFEDGEAVRIAEREIEYY